MTYEWAKGSRLSGSAESAGGRLETIRKKNKGRLTPAMVVADAQKKRSPLRDYFEWDDTEAAGRYRIVQAQYVIRSIVVVCEDAPNVRPVRAFVIVAEDDSQTYTSIEHAMSVPELHAQVLARAKAELVAFQEKYKTLKEFAGLWPTLDKFAA